jgi:ketosteroid isomerase-like protein
MAASPEVPAAHPVRQLWERFEAREWSAAGAVLAGDFVCEWPQTSERFRGPRNYLAMNQNHPAPNWHITVLRLVDAGDTAAAEVRVISDDGIDICLGFYDIRDGRLVHAVEYWTNLGTVPTPAWRAEYTERM